MNKKNIVHIGTFGQPHGLKGEIKIIMFISSLDSFQKLNKYFKEDGETEWNFIKLRYVGKKLIAKQAKVPLELIRNVDVDLKKLVE